MELLGIWKLSAMMTGDENGIKMITAEEIMALGDTEDSYELKQMVRADFIISETALDVYYMPLESEMELAEEEGLEVTEHGVLIESYPARIVDGTLQLDYDREGKEYWPVKVCEDGCLSISDDLMRIRRVQ